MNNLEHQNDYDEKIFGMSSAQNQSVNKRRAIRYIRTDIEAFLAISNLFSSKKNRVIKLLDISSKGATIECERKLKTKCKVVLKLVFMDKKTFIIDATIIHQDKHNKKLYGLQFAQFNNDLGDQILASQQDLIFK